ncbi:SGNH/GDSL hydrolase family protein [Amnibacterium sp. CER49]|uniref:SGNH/GDSL hydrolase family protein n=1 Tax=Amnibacterium sp. CER49 TaxID=3039161 RepID=UPI0024486C5A|nr:SGNH/GDSL hydrolase family protein [Amnibacterium sp. CER49]MDH2445158.1 SGNH/GDSL hydrolase family protein [Amnibacterium sp. CER49]
MAGIATALVVTLVLTAGSLLPHRHPRVLYVLGDSWSAGLYADPARALAQDAAAELHMTPIVDAQSGTGYLIAPAGTQTYPQRAAAISVDVPVSVVVIQGGSNDDVADLGALPKAVTATIDAVERTLPGARIVLLGPGPDPWPVTAMQRSVDAVLARTAASEDVTYLSPMREGWFTSATIDRIIDPANAHPTAAGQAILGHLLAQDLRDVLPLGPAAPGRGGHHLVVLPTTPSVTSAGRQRSRTAGG